MKPLGVIPFLDAKSRVLSWKADGASVAFTNGCFDMLHVGHLRCLLGAVEEADVLLVAVDSDTNVRSLKGERRPIIPDHERAELVAAVRGVTAVIIFEREDESVAEMLSWYRPDVYCKGTDYELKSLPEREILKHYNIRFAAVGDPKNHSTEEIVEKKNA